MVYSLRMTRLSIDERKEIGSRYFNRKDNPFKTAKVIMTNFFYELINRDLKFRRLRSSDYKFIRKIGEGKFSTCYYAENSEKKPVAIKYLKNRLFFLSKTDYNSEIKMLRKIDHPKIPKLLEVISGKQLNGLVMEYMPGTSLRDMIYKEKKSFSIDDAYKIYSQILEIAVYLHEKEILHNEFRPQNILYFNGDISIVDCGFSCNVSDDLDGFESDYVCLGEMLLIILYSGYTGEVKGSWQSELGICDEQNNILMKLL